MKKKLDFLYKIVLVFFVIFHFHPKETDTIFMSISYFLLLIVFFLDFIRIIISYFKSNKIRNDEKFES
jgi:hypothetical protein